LFKETDITIDGIEHMRYKERYSFKQNNETAIVDFEYNSDGFWGRVLPIKKNSVNQNLFYHIGVKLSLLK
jgi:hypothetical protein